VVVTDLRQRRSRPQSRVRVISTCVVRRRSTLAEPGRIVFEGTPADLVAGRATLTGEHLADYVGA
jgi:hypothetical protein